MIRRTFWVENIDWDTDGEDVDLPTTLAITLTERDIENIKNPDEEELEEVISDKLSDITGFCHNGWESMTFNFFSPNEDGKVIFTQSDDWNYIKVVDDGTFILKLDKEKYFVMRVKKDIWENLKEEKRKKTALPIKYIEDLNGEISEDDFDYNYEDLSLYGDCLIGNYKEERESRNTWYSHIEDPSDEILAIFLFDTTLRDMEAFKSVAP